MFTINGSYTVSKVPLYFEISGYCFPFFFILWYLKKISILFQNDTNIEENVDIDPHSFMRLQGNLSQNIEADMQHSTPSTSTNMGPPSTPSSMSQDGIYGDQTRKKKKRSLNTVPQTENERRAEEAYYVMKSSIKRDDCSTYGEHVGNELRKLSSKSQIYVKHMINNVLFKAALGVYDSQQITHEASISSPPTTVSTPDIDLNTNIQSPYDNQHTILVSEPSPIELATQHEPIDRNRDDESQSVLVEYLDQSSSLLQYLTFKANAKP